LGLKEIGYLKQIHSSKIYVYDGVVEEGDSLITNKANTGIGVFTADCVPVILVDTENKVISSVHSGWKGTYNELVAATIDKMIVDYGSKVDNIKVFIGPHIKECCYEVSEELIKSFYNKETYKNTIIAKGRNLNLEKCVIKQCISRKIPNENIHSVGLCTYCSKDYEFYSYRKDKECGRLFSMAFIKE
jgi:YfiH family protein